MPAVLDRAIETYRRQTFLEAVNAAYGRLRNDPAAWGALEDAYAAMLAEGRRTLSEGVDIPLIEKSIFRLSSLIQSQLAAE